MMLYCQRVPRPPLDAFVAIIWACRGEPQARALERIMPTGAAQLIVNLAEDRTRRYDPDHGYRRVETSGTILSGASSRYQVIDTAEQEHVAGVAFRPGGASAFMRVPAQETADADVPLEAIWGVRRAAALRERLLESGSLEAMLDILEQSLCEAWTGAGPHPAVVYALRAFDRAPQSAKIAAVAGAVGLSPKRFIERFKADVGVTPKRYCRIRRFQHAVALAHRGRRVDWAQVALDCGYFDQAHFIHEFRSFSGLTPTAYDAGRTPFPNHVKILQSGDAGV